MKKFISAKMINLADPRIGSKVIFKTDDFFAAAHRILNIETPVFKNGWTNRKNRILPETQKVRKVRWEKEL